MKITRLGMLALAALLALGGLVNGQEHGRGYVPLTPHRRAELQAESSAKHGNRCAMLAKNQALPAAFDCRDKGWVPPVGDQGNCGSCYLCSTVRTMTCAYIKAGAGKPDGTLALSWQYGMDRPRNFGGCGGGNGTEVVAWACKSGWIAETYIDGAGAVHNDYPKYSASSGSDRTKPGAKVWMRDATWGFVSANDGTPTVAEIKAALYNFGPLNIAIDAGGQFGNGTGTITSLGSSIDHEICVVGYDDNKDGGSVLLNNQWGADWGNGGYRWCTYAAAKRIVDWFYVSATPLVPPDPPPPPPGLITLIPAALNLQPGGKQQFKVTPEGAYAWSASGGTVTQDGLYTAPDKTGTYSVAVTVPGDPTQYGRAAVTVGSVPNIIATFTIDKALPAGTYNIVAAPKAEPMPPAEVKKAMETGPINVAVPVEPPVIIDLEPEQQQRGFDASPTYDEIKAYSLATGKIVVVGVGGDAPAGAWLRFEATAPWKHWSKPSTVVMQPRKDGLLHELDTLPPNASADAVRLVIERSLPPLPKSAPKKRSAESSATWTVQGVRC